jgi:hypothetical protein
LVSGLEEHRRGTLLEVSFASRTVNIPSGTLDTATNVFIAETTFILRKSRISYRVEVLEFPGREALGSCLILLNGGRGHVLGVFWVEIEGGEELAVEVDIGSLNAGPLPNPFWEGVNPGTPFLAGRGVGGGVGDCCVHTRYSGMESK